MREHHTYSSIGYPGGPYLIPVYVFVARVLGFGGLLSNRRRISAPVDLIGRTQVWDKLVIDY